MRKTLFVSVFVVLLSVPVYADFNSRCPKSQSSCSRQYIRQRQKLRGRAVEPCTIQHETDCETFTLASQSCIGSNTIYQGNGTCRTVGVEQDVECWARAAASAFASASVNIECKSKGKACIKARVEAKATACAVAEAIVDISIPLGNDRAAACQAAVDAVITNIASASANAMASACAKKKRPGMAQDFQFSSEVKSVISRAFAACWVYCTDVDGEQVITSEATGGVHVQDTSPPQNATGI